MKRDKPDQAEDVFAFVFPAVVGLLGSLPAVSVRGIPRG